MSADARAHLTLWLDHNIDLARRARDSELHALEHRMAARGLYYSGAHIKEAIRVAASSVAALTGPAFDKVGTLRELSDGLTLARDKLEAYAREAIAATDALIDKITRGAPTSGGLRRAAKELQEPILRDLQAKADLTAFSLKSSYYQPPALSGRDIEASRAAAKIGGPLTHWLDARQAALWIVFRDQEVLASSGEPPDFPDETARDDAYGALASALIERSLVAFGLTANEGWSPIPADQFRVPAEVTLDTSPFVAYDGIYIPKADLLAVFPPIAAGQERSPAPEPKTASGSEGAEGRLPRLPDAVLRGWWHALGQQRDSLPVNQLWAAAKAAYPKFAISRDRIREIAGPRKRGPKGLAEK